MSPSGEMPVTHVSFDPRRYGDLGVSLVIPLIALAMGGIGFPGGAVYLRTDLMRSRPWRSAASLGTGRRRVYCSAACKQRAYDRRRIEAAMQAGEERGRDRARPFLA